MCEQAIDNRGANVRSASEPECSWRLHVKKLVHCIVRGQLTWIYLPSTIAT